MMSSSVSVPYLAASPAVVRRRASSPPPARAGRPRRSVGVRTLAKMIASIGGIGLAVAIQPYRRQAQALAVDLRHRAVAAGCGAADVRPVRAHAAEAEQPAVVEGRRDDVHVRQMRAALIRIVVDEHVARADIGERLHDRAHRVRHGAEMDRQIGALRHHVAPYVEDTAGVVAGHFQQRRIRRLGQDDLHLLRRTGERVLHHLETGRVGLQSGHVHTCHCAEEKSDTAIPITRVETASSQCSSQ